MKKYEIFVAVATILVMTASCSQKATEKQALENNPGLEVQGIALAKQNALLGYETQNPLLLLSAAQLLLEFPGTEIDFLSVDEPGIQGIQPKGNVEVVLNPIKLLEDAEQYAQGNTLIVELINEMKNKPSQEISRGAVGGPYYVIRRVEKYSTNTYRISFRANELAEVLVIGDGDTDLDLFVFDINKNLIEDDDDYTDRCYVSWVPKWTGEYIIVIKNLGSVYNNFALITN